MTKHVAKAWHKAKSSSDAIVKSMLLGLAFILFALALLAYLNPAQPVTKVVTKVVHQVSRFYVSKTTTVMVPSPSGPFRHVADGSRSLDEVAAYRHVPVSHLITETEHAAGRPGRLSAQNLKAFQAYVKAGTGKDMPAGLVYYTSSGPAEG